VLFPCDWDQFRQPVATLHRFVGSERRNLSPKTFGERFLPRYLM
jgi:hypothetical protein